MIAREDRIAFSVTAARRRRWARRVIDVVIDVAALALAGLLILGAIGTVAPSQTDVEAAR